MMKMALNKSRRDEKGQALILVLILLLVGSVIIASLLGFMSTGLIAGQVYEEKADELYAADAGVEDALWQIRFDQLTNLFPSYDPYAYYDYDPSYQWAYALTGGEQVNGKDVAITMENVWIPMITPVPRETEARGISEALKLVVTGSIPSALNYQIRINFTPEAGEEDALYIETLGIWLPPGFDYVAGSSNLEADPLADYYSVPVVSQYAGGQAVVWSFGAGVSFTGGGVGDPFPGVIPGEPVLSSTITFQFTSSQVGGTPEAIAWVTTSGVVDVPFSWDADTKVYKITSTAGSTTVDAYSIRSEMRHLGPAMSGDYRAVGNTLMLDQNNDRRRETLLAESSATVSDLPSDAAVTVAYLYWSGWFEEGMETIIFEDDCSDMANWIPGPDWQLSSGAFRGHHEADQDRYLIMSSSLDLSAYSGQTVKVSWQQWENGWLESSDALRFQFSGDGGSSWGSLITAFSNDIGSSPQSFSYTVPDAYLTNDFKMRFYLDYFGGWGEYAYIDNFAVVESVLVADTTAIFKIDGQQVYLDGNGDPQMGAQEIIADSSQLINNLDYGNPHGYSYSSFKDVTALVWAFTDEGNATYTVGSVDATWDAYDEWAYAGWSLIIIYSSSETKGHQLYLYDDFLYADHYTNLDFDSDGQPGGTISGFLVPEPIAGEVNAATLTAFVGEGDDVYNGDNLQFNGTKLWDGTEGESLNDVWNSQSLGFSAEGVDVDTFYVTWASDLLEPGDTSAQIDIYTDIDIWNFVYLILSFRSEVTTGGTVIYLIR